VEGAKRNGRLKTHRYDKNVTKQRHLLCKTRQKFKRDYCAEMLKRVWKAVLWKRRELWPTNRFPQRKDLPDHCENSDNQFRAWNMWTYWNTPPPFPPPRIHWIWFTILLALSKTKTHHVRTNISGHRRPSAKSDSASGDGNIGVSQTKLTVAGPSMWLLKWTAVKMSNLITL
jgi:hypothetical protein